MRPNAFLAASALLAAATLGLSGPAFAQAPRMTAAQDQSVNPADRSLMVEYAALGLMNDTLGAMIPSAERRVSLMGGFLKGKSLDDDFRSYAAPAFPAGITFRQALDAAVEEAKLSAPSMAEDHETLAREVAAQTQLVQGSWDRVQALRKQVWGFTSFLRDRKLFDEYHAYAVKQTADEAAQAKSDADAKRAAADQAAKARDAQKTAALQQLQQRWDKIPYSTGVDYHYRFSQGSEATPDDFPYGNGSYSNDNYWNGSYYNGYADPYYDVWGGTGWAGGWGSYWRGRGHGTGDFHPHAAAAGGRR